MLERLTHRQILITVGPVSLPGDLATPAPASGAVIFAHGSGSSRLSPRNIQVARTLNEAGLATLLFDLLTPVEAADRGNVFDIELLGARLGAATEWLRGQAEVRGLPVGYFGASTGAAAALWAAGEPGARVAAIVSRGGRPDLAGSLLGAVTAPTLLIVGGDDPVVLDLNRRARQALRCVSELAVVPGATHLFEEPDALEQVADLAREWFRHHLRPAVTAS
jgi:pimeloyl-ACP methyl ester carboxylesterase